MTEPINKTGAEILQKLLHTPQVVITRTSKRLMDAVRTLHRLGLVTLEPGQVDSVVIVKSVTPKSDKLFEHTLVSDSRHERVTIYGETGQHFALYIGLSGYGDLCSTPGSGLPIALDMCDGNLQLFVWSDINQEDPTHIIDLEGAREGDTPHG